MLKTIILNVLSAIDRGSDQFRFQVHRHFQNIIKTLSAYPYARFGNVFCAVSRLGIAKQSYKRTLLPMLKIISDLFQSQSSSFFKIKDDKFFRRCDKKMLSIGFHSRNGEKSWRKKPRNLLRLNYQD